MTTFAILRYFLASSMSLFFFAFRAACLYSFILSFKKFSCCSAREVGLLFSAVKDITRNFHPSKQSQDIFNPLKKTIKTWGLFSRVRCSQALARISYTSNTIFLLNRAQVPFTYMKTNDFSLTMSRRLSVWSKFLWMLLLCCCIWLWGTLLWLCCSCHHLCWWGCSLILCWWPLIHVWLQLIGWWGWWWWRGLGRPNRYWCISWNSFLLLCKFFCFES